MLKIIVNTSDDVLISKEVIEYLREHKVFFVFENDLLVEYVELEYNGKRVKVPPGVDINDLIKKVIDGGQVKDEYVEGVFNSRWDRILSSGVLV